MWMFRVRQSGGSGFAEEDIQLEQFNCYLHSAGREEKDKGVDFEDLSEGVDGFVRERMRLLKKKFV